MCGLFGIRARMDARQTIKHLNRMASIIRHRGPDDHGMHVVTHQEITTGFGMNRLSIVDIGGGRQPIFNENCTLAVVFNGEIYNHRQLRTELAAKGHVFKTASDTEVILHAYEEYGERSVLRLDGMFAFAILELATGGLFLARDRFGIKPLFYTTAAGRFAFASESRALSILPWFSQNLDYQSVSDYFSLWYVPAPRSIWRDAKKLMPGTWMRVGGCGDITTEKYWKPLYRPYNRPRAQLREEYFTALHQSVQDQLMGEVPIGVFLSGGFDSGSIAFSLAKENGRNPYRTFSIGFRDSSFDESGLIFETVRAFGCNHTHRYFLGEQVQGMIGKVTDALDEPLGITAYPYYQLCQMAAGKVTVALSGDGGDELLGGYDTYYGHRLLEIYRHIPGPLRRALFKTMIKMTPVSYGKRGLDIKLKKFMEAGEHSPARGHVSWREIFTPDEKHRLLNLPDSVDLSPYHAFSASIEDMDNEEIINRFMCADLSVFLPEACLMLADRVGMSHSMEIRVPFLSNTFFDFASSLPIEWKVRGMTTKRLSRTFLSNILPKPVIKAPKLGFAPPFSRWILGPLKNYFLDLVSDDAIRDCGIINIDEARKVLIGHIDGKEDNHRKLMLIFGFLNWYNNRFRSSYPEYFDSVNNLHHDISA